MNLKLLDLKTLALVLAICLYKSHLPPPSLSHHVYVVNYLRIIAKYI